MRIPILALLLIASPAVADETNDRLVLARRTMEAHLRMGDALRAKGELDGALKAYRAAVAVYEAAVAPKKPTKRVTPAVKVEEEKPPPQTPAQRKRRTAQYIAVLAKDGATTGERYDATVQLGGIRHPDAIPALVRVLQKDKHELVRRAAAWSLGQFGKGAVAAVPALVASVKSAEPYVAYMATRALSKIAEDVTGKPVSMGFSPTMTAEERAKVHANWAAWWEANRAKFK